MHWAMAQLLHRTDDKDGAVFNEVRARRMAQQFLQELKRMGSWAVYQEDAAFIKQMLQAEDPDIDVEMLATPRLGNRPRLISTTDGGGRNIRMHAVPDSRPTRQWVDD
jgi:hypothetical protein